MRVDRGAAGALFSLVVLGGALVVLALIQYRSIEQLADDERQRMKSSFDFAARHFSDEFDRELTRLFTSFQMPRSETAPEVILNRYNEWAAMSHDAGMVKMLWFVPPGDVESLHRIDPRSGAIEQSQWPASLMRAKQMIVDDFERRGHAQALLQSDGVMLVPCGGPHPGEREPPPPPPRLDDDRPPPPRRDEMPPGRAAPAFVIAELDQSYLSSTMLPELARRYFENGYEIEVANKEGSEVLYRSAGAKAPFVADLSVPIYRVLSFANGRPTPPSIEQWVLSVRHPNGSLEETVAATRRRNLITSAGVLLVLAGSAVALMMMLRRAQTLRQQQLEFVAGMTHELNTPLAALQSAGQNLADGVTTEPSQVARYGAMITKESRRLGHMVGQVLEYAGMQSGRPARARGIIDVVTVINDALAHTKWLCDEERVSVEVSVAANLPHIEGDVESLSRAVQNLIGNAVKYGGTAKWIGVRAVRNGNDVSIEVADAGAGIAPSDAKHLFDPFYRGRGSDTARGSGLGLTIVKKIVDEHRGKIAIGRSSRGGASFTITIPEASRV